jgi:hypothetical protein
MIKFIIYIYLLIMFEIVLSPNLIHRMLFQFIYLLFILLPNIKFIQYELKIVKVVMII